MQTTWNGAMPSVGPHCRLEAGCATAGFQKKWTRSQVCAKCLRRFCCTRTSASQSMRDIISENRSTHTDVSLPFVNKLCNKNQTSTCADPLYEPCDAGKVTQDCSKVNGLPESLQHSGLAGTVEQLSLAPFTQSEGRCEPGPLVSLRGEQCGDTGAQTQNTGECANALPSTQPQSRRGLLKGTLGTGMSKGAMKFRLSRRFQITLHKK